MFFVLLPTNRRAFQSPPFFLFPQFPYDMKKVLKFIGIGLGVVLLLVGGFAAFIAFKPLPTYEDVALPSIEIDPTPELLAHGQKLVMMNCTGCHMPEHSQQLVGMLHPDADSRALGMVYNANLTQDPEHGIGQYTTAELYRLLRTGIKRDGGLALPIMPRLPGSSDYDVKAIIAFLQSDHPAVQPNPTQHPAFEPTFLTRMLYTVAWKPLVYPAGPVASPDPADQVDYGKYLVQHRYECFVCHSGDINQVNHEQPELTPNYLGGGMVFNMEYPDEKYPIAIPSLLRDGHLSVWSEDEFISAVIWGQRAGREPYRKPMHPYTMMDSTEARAIYRYLQQVEPTPLASL